MTLPLSGIKVLDLSRLLPGPYCSQVLADFGAEVLKVEDVNRGDYLRWFPPMTEKYSALYYSVNRNKKSMKLDLKREQGKKILRQLVKKADVLLEGFRPGVMEKLGLGYDELKKINPRLIYCAITGYGRSGPYKDMVGHDLNYLSLAGITGLIGHKGEKPALADVQIADIGGGALWGIISILLALKARDLTGEGQLCDVAMLDGVISWLPFVISRHAAGEQTERGHGLLAGGYACYNIYPTADGKYVSLGAIEKKFWNAFCRKINREAYIAIHLDISAQEAMIKDLQAFFQQKTQQEWVEFFAGDEICFTPVHDFKQVINDPQIREREMIIDASVDEQQVTLTGIPVKLSQTPGIIKSQCPKHGEHTKEVLAKLGYNNNEILQFESAEII